MLSVNIQIHLETKHHCVTTEKVPAKYRSLQMADASLSKCSIFVYSGGIALTRHRLSGPRVKMCVETFWNTGRVVGNPGKAVRGICRSAPKRTVMRIWREGTCSSKCKPENGTCWMRTVLAEWERYLQSFEIGWKWEWSQLFFHSCLKYHQSISSEK